MLAFGIIGGALLSLVIPYFVWLYLAGMSVYLLAVLWSATQVSIGFRLTILVALGIIATHLIYGIWFVFGLLAPRLSEEPE